VKLASTRYLDGLPTQGSEDGHAFRDLELEAEIHKLTQQIGIGAQFGGKYFCHDVRVIRLPRHGASLPIGLGVSCSADRQALGKITREGVFLEELETIPAQYLPEIDESIARRRGGRRSTSTGRWPRSSPNSRRTRSDAPLADRPLIVARDIAHAKIKERLEPARACRTTSRPPGLLRRPGQDAEGYASGSFGPTTAGRMDSYVDQFQAAGGSMVMLAKGNRSRQVREACKTPRRLLPRLDRRPGRAARAGLHQEGRGARVSRARHGGDLADRGRGLPRLHRRRRQGQRLLPAARAGQAPSEGEPGRARSAPRSFVSG
jgi:fumarate hydratase, class I